MENIYSKTAYFHLPGLFEFNDFYSLFLPFFYEHSEYFYDNARIGSIYGAPAGSLWGGGRVGLGEADTGDVLSLLSRYGISGRLTFSNSLLREEHLADRRCNELCELFEKEGYGVIIHSDLLLDYLKKNYPDLYFVSSTTKVQKSFDEFRRELDKSDFRYVVPDFRLNKDPLLKGLSQELKDKTEFLCNECCWTGCRDRAACYENVSRKILGEDCPDHICTAPGGSEGYKFSRAMESPAFIGIKEIQDVYLPMGFSNFKIEGRGLGSALLLEFILYYMTKPQYQIHVREALYLDSMLDLF